MKKYEITFIVTENVTEDKAKEIAGGVRKLFESHGAKIEKDFYWGKRKLIYKISKNTFGYYFVLIFDLDSNQLKPINQELRMNEKVIRYLIVDFIENSPFFELEDEKGKKASKPSFSAKVSEEKEKKAEKKIKEPVEEKEEVEPKAEIKEEAEPVLEESEAKEEVETKEEVEEAEVEEKTETKETDHIEEASEEVMPKEEVSEPIEDEEKIERKSDKKKMTDEERKEQLDKKLAELLKDEE